MHEPLLAKAAWPDTYHVLRLKLTPYSIGHELLLFREASPLVMLTPEGLAELPEVDRIEAVKRAALICSRNWRDNQADVANLSEWLKKSEHDDHEAALQTFLEYQAAGGREFRAELPADFEGKTVFRGAPQLLQLWSFVVRHVPRDEIVPYGTSAWDFPLGFAKMLWQCHAEAQGALEIYNFKSYAHDQFVAEQEAIRIAAEEKLKQENNP